eukprot:1159036-Pelagomonas_calceolata.AAC.9
MNNDDPEILSSWIKRFSFKIVSVYRIIHSAGKLTHACTHVDEYLQLLLWPKTGPGFQPHRRNTSVQHATVKVTGTIAIILTVSAIAFSGMRYEDMFKQKTLSASKIPMQDFLADLSVFGVALVPRGAAAACRGALWSHISQLKAQSPHVSQGVCQDLVAFLLHVSKHKSYLAEEAAIHTPNTYTSPA